MKYIILILVPLLFSCKSSKKDLELTILNKKFVANCPKNECVYSNPLNKEEVYNVGINILRFKVENKSNQTYFFMPIGRRGMRGNVSYASFPKLFSGLSLNNLLIRNSKGEIIEQGGSPLGDDEYTRKTDSLMVKYYKKMNYGDDRSLAFFKALAQNIMLVVPAGETVFYETFFTLPINQSEHLSSQEAVKLVKDKKYTASLIFAGEKELVEKRLTNAQKETIKHNNYKIFDGELISTNNVPIIFKN